MVVDVMRKVCLQQEGRLGEMAVAHGRPGKRRGIQHLAVAPKKKKAKGKSKGTREKGVNKGLM